MQWKHTKGISVVQSYRLNQRSLFLLSSCPPLPLHPSSPAPQPSSSLCCVLEGPQHSGRACLYQCLWIPHSNTSFEFCIETSICELGRTPLVWLLLLLQKKKLYDYLFWSCCVFLAEMLIFKSRRTSFRVDVWNLRDGGWSVFFIRHWVTPTLWW